MKDASRRKADLIVSAAKEHKAFDMVLLKVDELTSIADYYFICSCRSSRQVQAVTEHILARAKEAGGYKILGVEGKSRGQWALLDFGDVVAHVFYEPLREFYDLESLWIEAPRIDVGEETGLE